MVYIHLQEELIMTPKETFEKLKNKKAIEYLYNHNVVQRYTQNYVEYLESLVDKMLEALIELYKWQQTTEFDISLVWMSNTTKLIESVSQQNINNLILQVKGKDKETL